MFLPIKDNIPKLGIPAITIALVVLNCLVFLAFESNETKATKTIAAWGAVPHELVHPGQKCVPRSVKVQTPVCGTRAEISAKFKQDYPPVWLTIISSMFLHAGVLHLVGNMLFLFVFGWALEGALGAGRFLGLYLVGGIAAVAGQTLWNLSETVPMVGASGAIAAVMGAYLVLFPGARVMSLLFGLFPCEVRAIWVLLTWLVSQAVIIKELDLAGVDSGTAAFAHLGGFALGAGAVMLLLSREEIEEQRQIAEWASKQEAADEAAGNQPAQGRPIFHSGSGYANVQGNPAYGGMQFYQGAGQVAAPATYAQGTPPPQFVQQPQQLYQQQMQYSRPPTAVPPQDPFAPPPPPPAAH